MVRDLDLAAEMWKRLGFTVSPRGTHSAHMGSGNHTIMLDPDYIELLGVLAATDLNAPARAFLAQREGIERIALTNRVRAAGDDGGCLALAAPADAQRFVTMCGDVRFWQREKSVHAV